MISHLQKQTGQAIINIFETGLVHGDYSVLSVLADDPGLISYGRAQTTLSSGHLGRLITAYCQDPQARDGAALRPYATGLRKRLRESLYNYPLHRALRRAGSDPIMQALQDVYVDEQFWHPATAAAQQADISSALGTSVVYDSFIHGNWEAMYQEAREGYAGMGWGEHALVRRYIAVRWAWLARHPRQILRKTVYRMETFHLLCQQENWRLTLPLVVRGIQISAKTFSTQEKTGMSSRRALFYQLALACLQKTMK